MDESIIGADPTADTTPSRSFEFVIWYTYQLIASLLHPGADERDELAPEEEPIIAIAVAHEMYAAT